MIEDDGERNRQMIESDIESIQARLRGVTIPIKVGNGDEVAFVVARAKWCEDEHPERSLFLVQNTTETMEFALMFQEAADLLAGKEVYIRDLWIKVGTAKLINNDK
ncbi:MAG: hypothetical protein LUC22_07320 [Prevotella sp.]|nr:hypothetical protein [Prevotella sp.]